MVKPLTDTQRACLAVLDDAWPATVTPVELATRMEIPTHTAIAHVATLINSGYATRTTQPSGVTYRSRRSDPIEGTSRW